MTEITVSVNEYGYASLPPDTTVRHVQENGRVLIVDFTSTGVEITEEGASIGELQIRPVSTNRIDVRGQKKSS